MPGSLIHEIFQHEQQQIRKQRIKESNRRSPPSFAVYLINYIRRANILLPTVDNARETTMNWVYMNTMRPKKKNKELCSRWGLNPRRSRYS